MKYIRRPAEANDVEGFPFIGSRPIRPSMCTITNDIIFEVILTFFYHAVP